MGTQGSRCCQHWEMNKTKLVCAAPSPGAAGGSVPKGIRQGGTGDAMGLCLETGMCKQGV